MAAHDDERPGSNRTDDELKLTVNLRSDEYDGGIDAAAG
jgi:hypothetical protein